MSFPTPENMPDLNLSTPEREGANSSVDQNEALLGGWIKRLPKDDLEKYTELYLDALKGFNQTSSNEQQQSIMLDLYRAPLNDLLFSLTPFKLSQIYPDLNDRNNIIDALTELMAELALGYKKLVIESGKKIANLTRNPIAIFAINRACEQLGYMALHAYKFNREVPNKVFNELHQLYQLALLAEVEKKIPFINQRQRLQAKSSFKERYCQILLISISNPYGLKSGEVLHAYHIMQQFSVAAQIAPLPMGAEVVAGQFYINCLADKTPLPSELPMLENQTQPPTLVLDTKPAIGIVDSLLKQASVSIESAEAIDRNVLKQLIPYFNTSYERKQKRMPVTGNAQVCLTTGLEAIHKTLMDTRSLPDDEHVAQDLSWDILNKNKTGYLLCRQDIVGNQELNVGDFVAISEVNATEKTLTKLACIRWIKTDFNNKTKLGLDIIEGEPMAVRYSLDSMSKIRPAILLPETSQAASLITMAGVFKRDKTIHIIPKKKRFQLNIMLNRLLNKNASFERFTFRDIM
ncbi:MAG: hypothetical protein DRQ40_02755 [Gammaproteobacteria bacterium]|nr:MAG: hypothetical protein DRQ40_02755 [Gammaproteobacteria bacterium]